ncbi:MAG: hypothetical protein QXL15_00380 [Candidatus Korarchaeota archaeon]
MVPGEIRDVWCRHNHFIIKGEIDHSSLNNGQRSVLSEAKLSYDNAYLTLIQKRIANETSDFELYRFFANFPIDSEDVRVTYGLVAFRLGKWKKAKSILTRGSTLSKLVLARMYISRREYKKALNVLKGVTECAWATVLRAYSLLALGLAKKALEEINNEKRKTWELFYYKAIAEAKTGDIESALKDINEALKLNKKTDIFLKAAEIAQKIDMGLAEYYLSEGGKLASTGEEIWKVFTAIVRLGTRSALWHSAATVVGYFSDNYYLLRLVDPKKLPEPILYIYEMAYGNVDINLAEKMRTKCESWVENSAFMLIRFFL